MELLIIMAVSITILMVIVESGQEEITANDVIVAEAQINIALDKLADAADFVYSQSTGATTEVYITLPDRLEDINVGNHYIEASLLNREGEINFISPEATVARLNGTISSRSGSKFIRLTNEGEYVLVEDLSVS